MVHRSRSLTEFLSVRAWIEPDHERPLRVVIQRRGMAPSDIGDEQAFADADRASAFVRTWLLGLVRRGESGERFWPTLPADDAHQQPDDRQDE